VVITAANQYVEEKKPWALAKDPAKRQELADTLYILAECMAHLGILLQAFLPETARKILERLKVSEPQSVKTSQDFMKPFLVSGIAIEKGEPLFPRLDEKTP
jgi:methionyl-tRNA synthetase